MDEATKKSFSEELKVVAVVIKDKKQVGTVVRAFDGLLLTVRGVRSVGQVKWNNSEFRALLLDPASFPVDGAELVFQSAPKPILRALCCAQQAIASRGVAKRPRDDEEDAIETTPLLISKLSDHFALISTTVELSHKNFTMSQILTRLLPPGIVVPSGFEQVGHIAHLNLSKQQEPHKTLIGAVLLECSRVNGVRTVVNKIDSISSEFRELNMEVIAGDNDFNAQVKQHGLLFDVPFDRVYWNSRLSHEHQRLVEKWLKPGDELFDVMAGVGPFAIPAALKGVHCYANDLNPASVDAMRINWRRAATNGGRLEIFNMDGRAFIAHTIASRLEIGPLPKGRRHFVMNLPALAFQFLDAFRRSQWGVTESCDRTFVIHVYGFSLTASNDEAKKDALRQVESNLQCTIPPTSVLDVHIVRDVAPSKLMVCVSFTIPPQIFE